MLLAFIVGFKLSHLVFNAVNNNLVLLIVW